MLFSLLSRLNWVTLLYSSVLAVLGRTVFCAIHHVKTISTG